VTNRPNIAMRLRPLKLRLRHGLFSLSLGGAFKSVSDVTAMPFAQPCNVPWPEWPTWSG